MVVNLLLFTEAMAVVIGAAAYQHRLAVRLAATNRPLADGDEKYNALLDRCRRGLHFVSLYSMEITIQNNIT